MDPASQHAARTLTELAVCREQLAALARRLREHPGVVSAQHGIDARTYESGPAIEMFAEAELSTGKAIVWGLDLRWGSPGWTIETYVRANDNQGQHPVLEFPVRVAASLDELLLRVREGLASLTASVEQIELASA